MRRVVINMQNKLFSHAISDTLRRADYDLEPYTVDYPHQVEGECRWLCPYALLMEVTGYTPWKLCERLKLRDAVKAMCPQCKIVLVVDEVADREVANQVKEAKKKGLIDQFIYGSISASYLADIIDSL
jgi:nitrogen regulatory protein PII